MSENEAYMLTENGKLFRKGVEIGSLKDDKIVLHPDHKNYQAGVTRWLRSKADEQENTKPEPVAPKVKLTEKEQEELDNKGIAAEAIEEAKKARQSFKDDTDFAEKTGCPEPPKKNPQFGDKTPAYVDWLMTYRKDKFAKIFGLRGKGQVPVIETNAQGIDEVTGYKEVDLTIRKTHITEKAQSDTTIGPDQDWDA